MLTVLCVKNGAKYTDEDVYILRGMVSKNISQPYKFCCLGDKLIDGVETLISRRNWPGWWMKLELFEVSTSGLFLYLDLDVVITGSLDSLISEQLSMPANWAQSGHGGCQSSVMAWGRDYSGIAASFEPELIEKPVNGNCGAYQGLWGDQEYITRMMGDPGGKVKPMHGIRSYKYHCRGGLPNDTKVVCFHGLPKPEKVSDEWVKNARTR